MAPKNLPSTAFVMLLFVVLVFLAQSQHQLLSARGTGEHEGQQRRHPNLGLRRQPLLRLSSHGDSSRSSSRDGKRP